MTVGLGLNETNTERVLRGLNALTQNPPGLSALEDQLRVILIGNIQPSKVELVKQTIAQLTETAKKVDMVVQESLSGCNGIVGEESKERAVILKAFSKTPKPTGPSRTREVLNGITYLPRQTIKAMSATGRFVANHAKVVALAGLGVAGAAAQQANEHFCQPIVTVTPGKFFFSKATQVVVNPDGVCALVRNSREYLDSTAALGVVLVGGTVYGAYKIAQAIRNKQESQSAPVEGPVEQAPVIEQAPVVTVKGEAEAPVTAQAPAPEEKKVVETPVAPVTAPAPAPEEGC